MGIAEIVWTEDRIAHIGRHGVETEEFEEICFGNALVLRRGGKAETPCITSWAKPRLGATFSASFQTAEDTR